MSNIESNIFFMCYSSDHDLQCIEKDKWCILLAAALRASRAVSAVGIIWLCLSENRASASSPRLVAARGLSHALDRDYQ